MNPSELPAALWELLARRWTETLEQHASDEQLAEIAQVVVRCMGPKDESRTHELSLEGTTARLLRRADFYELRRLQGLSSRLRLRAQKTNARSPQPTFTPPSSPA